jgi:amidase
VTDNVLMTRRDLLMSSVFSAAAANSQAPSSASARARAQYYLDRIDKLDRRGPQLRAVIEINPDALATADALDAEAKAQGPRGRLHGVPILIKDNIESADRMKTTAGSLALVDAPTPTRDAPLVERLRAAGAVILGKTNLSEWANFRSAHSVSGWSARDGQTRSPYALDRNPSGSSSGSGVAVAADLCAMAVGTETDGSIVSPSSVNGIVGIKPTVGLIPGAGIVPIAHSQDTAGPMARSVSDAAALLTVLATRGEDYTKSLNPNGLRGALLGVARKFFGQNAALDRVMEHAISELKRLGAEIIDPADLPSHNQFNEPEFEVLLYEFKTDLNAYLASRRGPIRSLKELIAFNEQHRREEMPYFDQEICESAEKKGPLTENAYIEALAHCRRLAREEGIDAVVQKHKLDAIVAPTNGPACLIDWINGDQNTGGCSTPAAIAGYPHVTVPAGFVQGLPVGLSFFGTAWSEGKLIRLAYAFEQATQALKAPQFLATAPIQV